MKYWKALASLVIGATAFGGARLARTPTATASTRLGCPSGERGAEMVYVPGPGNGFCIDRHEAKQGEYAEFLVSIEKEPPEQPEECKGNERFAPMDSAEEDTNGGECATQGVEHCPGFDPRATPERSMSCVDWCDARAYCAWAGKRLCGGLGGASLTVLDNTAPEAGDPGKSEWQFACTNGGKTVFPYGDELEPGRCVDEGPTTDRKTGSQTCTGAFGPYDDIQDMVGNLREWTGDCEEGHCAVQGGYYSDVSQGCATYAAATQSTAFVGIGFRCCADPVPE
jgi:formylglycine-generating enzyme